MNNYCKNAGNNLVLSAAFVSVALGKGLSNSELDMLGNYLQTIGQNLTSMAAAISDCEETLSNNCNNDTNQNDNSNTKDNK